MATNKERIETNNTRLNAISTQLDDLPPYIEPVASNISYDNVSSGLSATDVQGAIDELNIEKAPAYTYGTEDLTAGTSPLATGTLHFVYE